MIAKDLFQLEKTIKEFEDFSNSIMVIGVCTHPDFRGKGYASFCTAKLSYDMLKTAKRPCLFYDNPAAGKFLPQDRIQRDREMGFNCFVKII